MHTIVSTTNFGSPKSPQKLKFKYPQDTYSIIVSQQSLPPLKHQYFFPIVDVSKRFEESLEKCRKKHQKQKMKIKAIEKMTISKQLSENIIDNYRKSQNERNNTRSRCVSESVETSEMTGLRNDRRASELVDQLLLDIYGRTLGIGSSERIFETEYGSSTSFRSMNDKFDEKLQYGRLILKDVTELRILIGALKERVTYAGSLLVKQLKKRDALKSKQEKICNVVTAHLHAYSDKRSEDTNMRFSPNPVPGDSGFNQWRDAMKMVAKLPGGIPPEFRRKLWIALAEKHLQSKRVNWAQTEKLCFNEWANPDDSELGIQIVKDLHRTGCSLFCGAAGQENQALLKRVLLAYARWNKSVGYCQGFNMLAALILQVMDKNETDSVKVMIYLIEGVLPESYFANNLRGLSVDMIVFRDLLKMRLPLLSKHLEALQNDAREGNSYEPPLTNVFTMQWFLTLFCNCLPQTTVLRVWDLIFLEGNEILLRTAIAIWEKLSDRILAVNSADEFYSIMGVLTREMLEFGLVDSNTLIKSIVAIGTCSELNEMRDRYLYNITPWTQSVQSAAKKGFKLFYSDDDEVESDYDEKAAVTAAYGISIGRKRDKQQPTTREGNVIQPYAHGHPDRERLALDISALKKQYAKLRERQRQAHIILQAACAKQPMGQNSTPPPIAMNHLLLGKSAIVNSRGRRLGPPKGSIPPARTKEPVKKKEPVPSGETIQWKDTAKFRRRQSCTEETDTASEVTFTPESDSSSYSEDDASSTSTELCDEPGRMSDFDSSDDKFSDILESKRTVKSIKHNLQVEKLAADSTADATEVTKSLGEFSCSEVAEMRSEFKELISEINELKVVESNELLDLKLSDATDFSDFKNSDENDVLVDITNEPVDVKDNLTFYSSSSNKLEPIIDETLVKFDDLAKNEETVEQASPGNVQLCLNNDIISINEATITETNVETILKDEEDTFETFLQERVKILKENSSDSLTSPKEETISRRSSEEKLRRHKSYEETSSNHLEKSVIFKQQSFDIGILPIIETSLWKPYQIEEESPRDEIEEKQLPSNVKVIEETNHSKEITKQASVDLLTVEDKRLEAGRRNSERALKIIQENSLILHRILQQQKSSEKEDSEDELSRSPISKTFLRSESLLSKDEKTDEERSSKDGDEELESGVESFSVSPALLDEESDPSIKKDQFEDHDETLIISKNEDTSNEYSYKYQSSDNTSNIISSSIFEDSSVIKNEESNIIPKDLQMETSPITSTFSHDDYSPNIYEDSAKFDIASNILDYSKDNEENSSSSIQSDNKYTVEKYTSIEEISMERNTDRSIEDSLEKSPYRFSFKYKEDSEENIKISATVKEETSQDKEDKHEDLLSFLSSSPKVASSQTNNEDLMFEERSPDDFLSYLKNTDSKWKLDSSSLSKEESKSYPQEFKEDMLSFKIPEDDYSTKQDSYVKSYEKEEISSFSYNKSVDNTSPYKYSFREDSDDNIKDKYSSYLQNEDTVTSSSSKYYRSTSPIDDKFSLLYKTDTKPKQDESSIDNLDKLSSLYKDDIPSSSKFYYTPKYTLDSPEYAISNEANKTSMYSQENTNLNSASSSLVKTTEELVKPVVNDSTDNNSSEKSPDYQYNRSKLTIELVPTKYGEYSPEISPPKHLSCLQFTSFQTDIPCTSKSIQFSPICAQDKNDISPEKNSPTKTSPKYFSSFKLPTLSPPRRAVKSPLSPNKTFSPFPVQPTTRQPKELGVKLGMYKDLSPLKSPKK